METMQNAPLLHAPGLHEDFRLLADFGGAVLAGQERENGQGYQFVTWIWDYDRTGVSHGHYYEDDFQSAKRDFAVRSGLIPRAQLFTPEELTELYRAAEHWFYEGPELDYKQQKSHSGGQNKNRVHRPGSAEPVGAGPESGTTNEFIDPTLNKAGAVSSAIGQNTAPAFLFSEQKKQVRCSVWIPKN